MSSPLQDRAFEMARKARLSTPTDRTAYRRGNLNHGDITQGHRVTYIDRPNPTLPFEDEGDTLYAAWQEAVKRTVDAIFESHDSEGVR